MTEISRRQFAAYAVAVVLVVLLGGRALRAGGTPPSGDAAASAAFTAGADGGSASSGPTASGTTAGGGVEVTAETERVLVHVAGAVRHPGVYQLQGGARIQDALRKAGGGRAGADLDVLNLAAKVTDGQQVLVAKRARRSGSSSLRPPLPGAAATTGAPGSGATGSSVLTPVDVNTADANQLEALNGVGPAIASKIVEWRTQNGPFRTVDDLSQVSGIGPKKLEAMRGQVVI